MHAYHISTAQLFPPLSPHPSPPNVIAVSSDGNILLSASSVPPVIYMHDQRLGGSGSVRFFPTDSDAAVTCAAFKASVDSHQPSRTQFALGFQDGMVAVYRVSLPRLPQNSEGSRFDQIRPAQLQPARVGVMQKLHKGAIGGCTAVEFIPGYRSRIVSTGHDGRCRLVDFGYGGKILRT